MRQIARLVLVLTALTLAAPASAQISARMLRFPDVSATNIAFVYAGDIWVVPKTGGLATRLSSPRGEELLPRFSPDGTHIAFTGDYDGNPDVYVVPTAGGMPVRLTHHPAPDRMVDWYPDGSAVLYASTMESGSRRFNQLWRVAAEGGMPEKLPLPYGEFGAFSADGRLLAFQTVTRDFRTWKRYRGGTAPDIWVYDMTTGEARNVTHNDANDAQPMWHGRTLYFLSDRGPHMRANIWAMDVDTGNARQLTQFTDDDVHFPAIGPDDLVFEAGDRLWLMDLASEKAHEVKVDVVTDRSTLRPRVEKVADLMQAGDISPSGKRAVVQARGDLFSLPAEHGPVLDLTRTSGVAERYPSWSPDGKTLAYMSDRSGEYQLVLRPADGSGEERTVTSLGPGYRYRPIWSPDSKRIVFIDQTQTLRLVDVATGAVTELDRLHGWLHSALEGFHPSWSPDGRWLAYDTAVDNLQSVIVLYDTQKGERHQVTSGTFNDRQPSFDPDGKYLYYLSSRSFDPTYADTDATWIYANTTQLVAVPLRADVASPLAPRNDVEGAEDTNAKDTNAKAKDADAKSGKTSKKGDTKAKDEAAKNGAKEPPKPVGIDLDGFESRVVVLPPDAGNLEQPAAVEGKVLYLRHPRTGAGEGPTSLVWYDLEEREEKTVIGDLDGYAVSADGQKILVLAHKKLAIVSVAPEQKLDKPLRTDEMEMTVEPQAEWRQIFADVWRYYRDFFYDPHMHGVDWQAMRVHYGRMLDDAVTRWDVNYVIGELIGELNSSHTYRFGGDVQEGPKRGVGLLGADYELADGAFRIARILDPGTWDVEARSPLAEPDVNVKAGDYLLAVNGVPLDPKSDPWAAFEGLAGETVTLTVNGRPTLDGARQVLVKTLPSEVHLRYLDWVEGMRRKVDAASGGKVGYIHVPDTGTEGQTELVKQFRAQAMKPGLIVDERFNSGGQYGDRFIELLSRRRTAYASLRFDNSLHLSVLSRTGPMVMLANEWAGSGGDIFPYLFSEAGLGPVIGTRTWGGLIGIEGANELIDGGGVTVPQLALYGPDGHWLLEGHGFDPDIEVINNPGEMRDGRDPQLERAVAETLSRLKQHPPVEVPSPPYEDRTAKP